MQSQEQSGSRSTRHHDKDGLSVMNTFPLDPHKNPASALMLAKGEGRRLILIAFNQKAKVTSW